MDAPPGSLAAERMQVPPGRGDRTNAPQTVHGDEKKQKTLCPSACFRYLCHKITIMANKSITIRIPEEIYSLISKSSDSPSFGSKVSLLATRYTTIMEMGTKGIMGVFTPEEWRLMADVISDNVPTENVRFMNDVLAVRIKDSEIYGRKAEKYGVDTESLTSKILGLSPINIDAIYRRVEALWSSSNINIQKWSSF